ncbi:MAG: hypothetical protein KJO31_03415 [Gammaproteobacteria bacterium]|nr:hypothetical protein [Gammaproteobacteria bacterium]
MTDVADDTVAERISAVNSSLERAARDARWDAVAPLLSQREHLLASLPDARRREALVDCHRVTRQVLQLAREARRAVSEQLCGLKKGRAAADAYTAARNEQI